MLRVDPEPSPTKSLSLSALQHQGHGCGRLLKSTPARGRSPLLLPEPPLLSWSVPNLTPKPRLLLT